MLSERVVSPQSKLACARELLPRAVRLLSDDDLKTTRTAASMIFNDRKGVPELSGQGRLPAFKRGQPSGRWIAHSRHRGVKGSYTLQSRRPAPPLQRA